MFSGKKAVGASAEVGRAHSRRPFSSRFALTIMVFLAPAFIFVAIFTYYPMLRGAQMAFRKWDLWNLNDTPFVGFGNFQQLIFNPLFLHTMVNSLIWVVVSIIPQFVIGFLIALALRNRFRFRGLYQAVIFTPGRCQGS